MNGITFCCVLFYEAQQRLLKGFTLFIEVGRNFKQLVSFVGVRVVGLGCAA